MAEFDVYFYRAGDRGVGEIGPCPEYGKVEAPSKAQAEKKARVYANQQGWRFMGFYQKEAK